MCTVCSLEEAKHTVLHYFRAYEDPARLNVCDRCFDALRAGRLKYNAEIDRMEERI